MTARTGWPAVPPYEVAAAVRKALLDHRDVHGLDGGTFGAVATHAPGGRVIGVLVTGGHRVVEISVVLRLTRPLPEVVPELRALVREVVGDVRVDVTINDVVPADTPRTEA